jgi:hypothetical protein
MQTSYRNPQEFFDGILQQHHPQRVTEMEPREIVNLLIAAARQVYVASYEISRVLMSPRLYYRLNNQRCDPAFGVARSTLEAISEVLDVTVLAMAALELNEESQDFIVLCDHHMMSLQGHPSPIIGLEGLQRCGHSAIVLICGDAPLRQRKWLLKGVMDSGSYGILDARLNGEDVPIQQADDNSLSIIIPHHDFAFGPQRDDVVTAVLGRLPAKDVEISIQGDRRMTAFCDRHGLRKPDNDRLLYKGTIAKCSMHSAVDLEAGQFIIFVELFTYDPVVPSEPTPEEIDAARSRFNTLQKSLVMPEVMAELRQVLWQLSYSPVEYDRRLAEAVQRSMKERRNNLMTPTEFKMIEEKMSQHERG